MEKKYKNLLIGFGVVFLLILVIGGISQQTQPPKIVSGVTKSGEVKANDYGGYRVKIHAPSGKYLVFTEGGKVAKVARVKSEYYTYSDSQDFDDSTVVAYATNEKVKIKSSIKNHNTIGKVKFTVPAMDWTDDDDDSSYDDTDYDNSSDDTEDSTSTSSSSSSTPTYRTDITYDQLARDPASYKGESFTLTGEVLQVIEDDDVVNLRVAINGDYDDVVLVEYDPSIMSGQRVLEDDKVTFSGMSLGTTTYESTMGGSITIPAAEADLITDAGTAPDSYGY